MTMEQSKADRLAYLQHPVTRGDLIPLITAVTIMLGTVAEVALALGDLHSNEAGPDDRATPYEVIRTVTDQLGPLLTVRDKLHAQVRELGNAGVDPEWDHQS